VKGTSTQDLSQLTTKSQFNTSISELTDRIQDLQSKIFSYKEETNRKSENMSTNLTNLQKQVENIKGKGVAEEVITGNSENLNVQNSVLSLEKGLRKLEEELRKKLTSNQESNISLIEKHRRSWEGTREKAEQMSQIFDSLIITNDRPYVSCGIDSPLNSSGIVIFNQFELINKIEWENEDGFCLVEPGVYLLQVSGSLANCNVMVKLVSEQLEAELVTLSSSPTGTFKSRSTIFTVEDDDRDAEKIVVDIQDKDGVARLDSDFTLLMYKISEVSNSEANGDSWRLVDI